LGAIAWKQRKFKILLLLVDKGYHNGREIAQCINNNITTIAHPTPGRSKESYQPEYLVAHFSTTN
jgi:hypothetical protein